MQPISQKNPNIHKGPSSSSDFNEIRNNMHHDLVSLFNVANHNEQVIKDNMDVLLRENFFLQNKLMGLERDIEKVYQDVVFKEDGLDKQRLIKSFYSLEGIADGSPDKEAQISTMYGYLGLMPSDTVSKLSHRSDDGQVVIPESLEVKVLESNNTRPVNDDTGMRSYHLVEDANTDLAFDKNKNSFWVHTSSFPEESGVSEVYGIMSIKLPLDTLNNLYANTLMLSPSPEYSMTIRDIQVKGNGEQWFRLPNYPTEKDADGVEVPIAIEDAGKRAFSFPKDHITEVQVMFAQPYWFSNEGRRDFVYGFQEVEVEHRIYNTDVAEVVTEFSLDGTSKRFHIIEEPNAIPLMGSEPYIDDLVEHKLYYNRDLTNEFSFGNEIMAPIQKVYVKTIIRRQGETVPVIKQINLDYTFKDITE